MVAQLIVMPNILAESSNNFLGLEWLLKQCWDRVRIGGEVKNGMERRNEDDDKDDDAAADGSDTTVLYTLHQTVDWTSAGFYGPHIRVWWSIPVIWP